VDVLQKLLEQQLLDQRLHYEKLIARETVRLLEMGFQVQSGRVIAPSPAPRTAADTMQDMTGTTSAPAAMTAGSFMMEGGGGGEFDAENIAADMEVIETLKLEISCASCCYLALIQMTVMYDT
jgi:hypothetical protein